MTAGGTANMLDVSYSFCSDAAWYLVHCNPRKELYAAHVLKSQFGLSVFLPQYKVRSRGEVRQLPFFPGYIFVQANLQKTSLSQINSSPGVQRLVSFDADPQPVPHYVIAEIAERLNKLDILDYQSFRPGDVVRLKNDNSLQDLEMVFVGPIDASQRVCVLLKFLGRLKKVYIDADMLEKKPVNPFQKRTRYTRGKGRKIKYNAHMLLE